MNRFMTAIVSGIAGITLASLLLSTPQTNDKEINIWNKVSTDEANPGAVITLDMSRGYSYCQNGYIFLVIKEVGREDNIILAFPDGGYWESPVQDPFLEALELEFNSLEEYLRNKQGQSIEKDY